MFIGFVISNKYICSFDVKKKKYCFIANLFEVSQTPFSHIELVSFTNHSIGHKE